MNSMIELASFVGTLSVVIGFIVVLLLHFVLAVAVAGDINSLRETGREPRFFGAVGWSYVVFLSGLVGFALYWVMHHSTLRDIASDRRRAQHA